MVNSHYLRLPAASLLAVLLAHAAPLLARPAHPPSQPAPNLRVVCKDILPTGSIVRTAMICMYESAWRKDLSDRDYRDDFSHEPLLALKQPKDAEMLKVGTAKWDRLPVLQARNLRLPYLQLVASVREMLRKESCVLPGQSAKAFDIDVRYGVFLEPDGHASRILVEDTQCPLLNSLVGLTVLARSDRGDFEPTGEAKGRWYKDGINFTLR